MDFFSESECAKSFRLASARFLDDRQTSITFSNWQRSKRSSSFNCSSERTDGREVLFSSACPSGYHCLRSRFHSDSTSLSVILPPSESVDILVTAPDKSRKFDFHNALVELDKDRNFSLASLLKLNIFPVLREIC